MKLELPNKPDPLLSSIYDRAVDLQERINKCREACNEEDCEDYEFQQGLKLGYEHAYSYVRHIYDLVKNFRELGI